MIDSLIVQHQLFEEKKGEVFGLGRVVEWRGVGAQSYRRESSPLRILIGFHDRQTLRVTDTTVLPIIDPDLELRVTNTFNVNSLQSSPPHPYYKAVVIFSVVVCLRWLYYHILSTITYISREHWDLVSIIDVQSMVFANDRIHWSCSFGCRLHHLIIIILQTYLKALNY